MAYQKHLIYIIESCTRETGNMYKTHQLRIEMSSAFLLYISNISLVEKGSKPAVWYIFTGGFSYQPPVLFLVA
jgi:hypothetical protein